MAAHPCWGAGFGGSTLRKRSGVVKKIERSALVAFSRQQMFALVNDIESYPQYMAGCVGAKILSRGDDWLEARLVLSGAGFKQSFITRNQLVEPSSMKMSLVEGPFKTLQGEWSFQALSDSACKVLFSLEYAFSNRLFGMAAGAVFEKIASEQVHSLCERAKAIYV